MFSADQWAHAVLRGAVFTGVMLLVSVRKGKPTIFLTDAFASLLGGLCYGLVATLWWQALKAPLLFITAPALVGILLLAPSIRRHRAMPEKP